MSDSEQANVRIPGHARETLMQIAKLLREDKSFLARLRRFIEEDQQPGVGALLSTRIERVEREMEQLRMQLSGGTLSVQTSGEGDLRITRSSTMEPGQTVTWTPPPGATWTTGVGKGKRLTPDGRSELDRLIDAGHSDSEIAKTLGIKPYAVTKHRKSDELAEAAEERNEAEE